MLSAKRLLAAVAFLHLLAAPLAAETVTATGTIESIDVGNRTITVRRKTANGEKTAKFPIGANAEIDADGQPITLTSLNAGESVTISYDTAAKQITAITVSAASPPSSASKEPSRIRAIFNGKDLTDWDGDPRLWSVRGGVLRGETTALRPAQGNTFLIWRGGRSKDFELRLSFRTSASGNSGIQYRSKRITEGKPKNRWAVRGYQYEIRNDLTLPMATGFLYDEGGKRGRLCLVGEQAVWAPAGKRVIDDQLIDQVGYENVFKLDNWNDAAIVARGSHIQHSLNGRLIADFTDNDRQLASSEGILALQLHAGEPMWVEFKNIRIANLEPSDGSDATSDLPTNVESNSRDAFQRGTVWIGETQGRRLKFSVLSRRGETFTAKFELGNGGVRQIKGTVKDGRISWLTKDVRSTGKPGGDNDGLLVSDAKGDRIDFVWKDDSIGVSGTFTLRLVKQ